MSSFPRCIGLAVDRTSIWKAAVDVEAKRLSLDAARAQIVQNVEEESWSIEAGHQVGMEANSGQDHELTLGQVG